jgi:hypothetical protein
VPKTKTVTVKRYTKRAGGLMGIDSLKDLFIIGYSVLGISLASDKIVNVANMQGTSFVKPLIAGAIGWFMTPKRQKNIITLLAVLASIGFSIGSLGRLGQGNPPRGQANINTANILGRLP